MRAHVSAGWKRNSDRKRTNAAKLDARARESAPSPPPLAAACVSVSPEVPAGLQWYSISQVWMYGWVRTLLFTPIVWAGTEAAHCGGSRSSGGSRLPLSNYCGDRKVSRRAIPSWEQCASRLQQHTDAHIHTLPSHKPVISALGTLSLWWSLYVR